MAIDYQKSADESIDAYNLRIAGEKAKENPFSASEQAQTSQVDKLNKAGVNLGVLSEQVLADTGALSSANENIQSFIDKAISKQEEAAKANRASVEATYSVENDYLFNKLQNQRTSLLELGGGTQGTGSSALMIVDKEIEKNLNNLKKEKDAAILAGDSKAADAISGMYLKQLEYQQQNKRDHLQGVLAAAGIQKDIATIAGTIATNYRNMTNDQLDYQIKTAQLALQKSDSAADNIYKMGMLSIAQSELALKQGESLALPEDVTAVVGSTLLTVGKGLKDETLTEQDAYNTIMDAYENGKARLQAQGKNTEKNLEALRDRLGIEPDGMIAAGNTRLGEFGSEAATLMTQATLADPETFFDMDALETAGSTSRYSSDVIQRDHQGNITSVFGIPVEKQ